jgi:predicted Fe-Mo cluster-binding NifX family protein
MSIRIAFASIDGTYIDQHFGNARIFQVFDVAGGSYELVESRKIDAFCCGHCEGGFDHLLEALSDCNAVFVGKIGKPAAAFMIQHGKRVFEASGPVEEIIAQIISGNLLDEL